MTILMRRMLPLPIANNPLCSRLIQQALSSTRG